MLTGCAIAVPITPKANLVEARQKIPLQVGLLITEETRDYVFRGYPRSFVGRARPHEFPLGRALEQSSLLTFSQIFEKVTVIRTHEQARNFEAIVQPEVDSFDFYYGVTDGGKNSALSQVKLKVKYSDPRIQLYEDAEVSPVMQSDSWHFSVDYEYKMGNTTSDAIASSLRTIAQRIYDIAAKKWLVPLTPSPGLVQDQEPIISPVLPAKPANTPEPSLQPPPAAISTSQGTCFVVSPRGLLLTAHHVIETASSLTVTLSDRSKRNAHLRTVSTSNDLALLEIEGDVPAYLTLTEPRRVEVGQPVFTLGFPVTELLGKEPKFTDGTISALSGPGGEASLLQISFPTQPGNSGGPLVNDQGEVVGIISSTAGILPFLKVTGTLPQNITWAVKADYARPLFDMPEPLRPTSNRAAAINRVRNALCEVEAVSGP
jgi:S1-C subfamily serine protease